MPNSYPAIPRLTRESIESAKDDLQSKLIKRIDCLYGSDSLLSKILVSTEDKGVTNNG